MSKDVVQDIARRQIENEWFFCASVFSGAHDIATRECAWLNPDSFVIKEIGTFWKQVLAHNSPIRAAQESGIDTAEIAKWSTRAPSLIKPEDYARNISESCYFRNTIQGAVEVVKKARQGDTHAVQSLLSKLNDSSPTMAVTAYDSTAINQEFHVVLSNKVVCTPTGLPALDSSIGGLFKQELTIFAGRPAMGKTAFAMQIARNVAHAGKVVVFFSLEMSRLQLWARMACGGAGIAWHDIRANRISAVDRQSVLAESKKLETLYKDKLFVQDEVYALGEMYQIVLKYKPDLVVVDHLDEIHWHEEKEERVSWYGKATKFLRRYLARRLDCHVLLVHQLNRELEKRTDKKPVLSDLRWSGELEQLADIVLMAYRDDYYSGAQAYSYISPFELLVRKNRQGGLDTVYLTYDRKRQWFDPAMP